MVITINIKSVILLLLIYNFSFTCFSQTSERVPVLFGQFNRALGLSNPAYLGSNKKKIEINLANQSLIGAFSNIRTYYGQLNYSLKKEDSIPKINHTFGLLFYSDREGSYISNTRIYGSYTIHLPITYRYTLSTGISLGASTINFDNTQSSASSSAIGLDGTIGLWLKSDNSFVGIAVNQLPQQTIIPLVEKYRLKRHLTVNICRKFYFSPTSYFAPIVQTRFFTNLQQDLDILLQMVLDNKVTFGSNLRYKKGIMAFAGLEDINMGDHHFRLVASYTFPLGRTTFNANQEMVEITLNYFINN